MITKSRLSRELGKIKGFLKPKLSLRQYMTPPLIASDLLWAAFMNKDLAGRRVFDLGCGTGMLTIGASLLGAKVTGFDIDPEAIKVAIENAKKLGVYITLFEEDIDDVSGYCETVIMNPPFMVKAGKNDKVFLEKAFSLCETIYSIHTSQTRRWVKRFADNNDFNSKLLSTHKFPLPKEFGHHEKARAVQEVDLWRFYR